MVRGMSVVTMTDVVVQRDRVGMARSRIRDMKFEIVSSTVLLCARLESQFSQALGPNRLEIKGKTQPCS